MPKQFFNIGTTIFTRLTGLLERDFSQKCQLSSEKKSNCRTCAEGCQMPFKSTAVTMETG